MIKQKQKKHTQKMKMLQIFHLDLFAFHFQYVKYMNIDIHKAKCTNYVIANYVITMFPQKGIFTIR